MLKEVVAAAVAVAVAVGVVVVVVVVDSLISWGEGSSSALVGNPSRDGVSIKILVWRHLKTIPQLL